MTTVDAPERSRDFCVSWSLDECRAQTQREPALHQAQVLEDLTRWYERNGRKGGAGILVLPTGGGKTFTAVRFLCSGPLSEGKKVLWLAHTHHLLEQAFGAFHDGTLGAIREPRRTLRLRVVSGMPGHYRPRDVRTDDDVVIATLQTVTNAWRENQRNLIGFLEEAGRDLVVVFDEAHHSPAPTYRKLLQWMQAQGATVLGLTATPVYTDERKQGWLWELFKDGILAQTRVQQLIAARVLAKPIFERLATQYQPSFDGRDYQKWLGTAGDLPEQVVTELAKSAERNAFIAQVYAEQRDKWGKTIIFTDRWYQCEAIAEALASHGVKAGSVYSKVDAPLATAEQRNRRRADENVRVLSAFRDGELDVLINVRMLTEGTDVPDVQTVFLTRQTTSRILLTQMVGRAMRGPAFGGTENASSSHSRTTGARASSGRSSSSSRAAPTTRSPSGRHLDRRCISYRSTSSNASPVRCSVGSTLRPSRSSRCCRSVGIAPSLMLTPQTARTSSPRTCSCWSTTTSRRRSRH